MCILLARCSLNVSFRSSFLHLGHVLLESKVAECNNFNVQKVIFFRHTHPPTHTHTLSHSLSLSLIHSLTHSLSTRAPSVCPSKSHFCVFLPLYSRRFLLAKHCLLSLITSYTYINLHITVSHLSVAIQSISACLLPE